MRHTREEALAWRIDETVDPNLWRPPKRHANSSEMCVVVASCWNILTPLPPSWVPHQLDLRKQFAEISRKHSPEPRRVYTFLTTATVRVALFFFLLDRVI